LSLVAQGCQLLDRDVVAWDGIGFVEFTNDAFQFEQFTEIFSRIYGKILFFKHLISSIFSSKINFLILFKRFFKPSGTFGGSFPASRRSQMVQFLPRNH
jgi:hypothetical protein